MRVSIFLAALMSLVLSVLSAAIADPPIPVGGNLNTTTDDHPLCGGFAWWNNNKWQEEKLWETGKVCVKLYHNAGRVNVADWGKCELCFFYPNSECTGHNTITVDNQRGWVDTKGDVWGYWCIRKP